MSYVFELYPEDWRGRIIEVYQDGRVMLDSGAFSKENRACGIFPVRTVVIGNETTSEDIRKWLEGEPAFTDEGKP